MTWNEVLAHVAWASAFAWVALLFVAGWIVKTRVERVKARLARDEFEHRRDEDRQRSLREAERMRQERERFGKSA